LDISTARIKELREESGAGVMACRQALIEAQGDITKALDILKQQGLLLAEKKAHRVTAEGIIEAYVHAGSRLGGLVEVNCETDFVARTDEFRELAHNIAMQVVALCPRVVSQPEAQEMSEEELKEACLLAQPYIKDPTKTIQDLINETIARTGENIKVSRFVRFELGEKEAEDNDQS